MSEEVVVCLVCGNPGTIKWTINGMGAVGIADLCAEHSEPVKQIMDLAKEKGVTGGKRERQGSARVTSRIPRRKDLPRPLDWKPPQNR